MVRLSAGLLVCFMSWTLPSSLILLGGSYRAESSPEQALVGHWNFDDGTGKDLSGAGADANLGSAEIYSLGEGMACVKILPTGEPLRIPASEDSPLAISRGTIALWINLGATDTTPFLEYDNGAVQLRVYRSHLQPRFEGTDKFKLGGNVWGDDWPQFPLREDAFYPHEKAVMGEGVWRHIAVAFDDAGKRFLGWRDGELIAEIDLSTLPVEPLKKKGLKAIVTDDGFAGFLDDLRVYSRVLSDSEIEALYEGTKTVYAGRTDSIPSSNKMEVYDYRAEDETLYRAWLQHASISPEAAKPCFSRIVAEGSDPTVGAAAQELADALESQFGARPSIENDADPGLGIIVGSPDTSSWIRENMERLGLERVRDDGYIIREIGEGNENQLVIASKVPAGTIFGAFDLIRRIQLGADLTGIDVLENPSASIRIVNHWDTWRGFPHDDWHGRRIDPHNWESNRNNSIYSWEELRNGETKRIEDWARLLASAGWNAVCPTEINWEFRNNFLEHLDEVETLAGIFRNYGIKLYWTPNHLLAVEKETADRLYERVPDFGGYLLKLGSEAQNGDPRPAMVNRIAENLKPHGGHALLRAFVYGKYRYADVEYRNMIPHDLFAPEDGNYLDNVVIISKGNPLDWDFSAPIPALDGAIQKNLYGSELVIAKAWPVSWIEKWKWWMEQDNYAEGPGSLNKDDATCILGVSMISPSPAWTSSPLNMVNYYGLGRLAWNPDLSIDELYSDWTRLTFGDDPEIREKVGTILLLSDDALRKQYIYRGYRGIWIDRGDEGMVENKTPHVINRNGMGVSTNALRERLLAQYSPGLREIYGDPVRGEEFLPSFNFVPHHRQFAIGRSLIEDVYANLDEAVDLTLRMRELWESLEGKVDDPRFRYTLANLREFEKTARKSREKMIESFEAETGRKFLDTISGLDADSLASRRVFDVRHFGAKGDGLADDTSSVQEAIDACRHAGGGTVFVPSGVHRISTLDLRDRVTLALDIGAVLKVDGDDAAAPASTGGTSPDAPKTGSVSLWSLTGDSKEASIRGENLEHVRILGPGAIHYAAQDDGGGAIGFNRCARVELRNLTILHTRGVAVRIVDCDDALVDNVLIAASGDGIGLARNRNAVVSHTRIDTVDRKDGRAVGGGHPLRVQIDPEETLAVQSCYLESFGDPIAYESTGAEGLRRVRIETTNHRRIGANGHRSTPVELVGIAEGASE